MKAELFMYSAIFGSSSNLVWKASRLGYFFRQVGTRHLCWSTSSYITKSTKVRVSPAYLKIFSSKTNVF